MIHTKTGDGAPRVAFTLAYTGFIFIVIAAMLYYVVLGSFLTDIALAVAGEPSQPTQAKAAASPGVDESGRAVSPEARIDQIEELLRSVKLTGEASESRSKENKVMARELIGYVKIMVAVLVAIAVGFPLAIWLMSRRRLLGLSGLSGEVTATLVLVEERQAKLANILKDIQNEIDYLHTMSVPDLKNLIQQAETYLKQNEKDLELVGPGKRQSQ